jgi:hypothetical protein
VVKPRPAAGPLRIVQMLLCTGAGTATPGAGAPFEGGGADGAGPGLVFVGAQAAASTANTAASTAPSVRTDRILLPAFFEVIDRLSFTSPSSEALTVQMLSPRPDGSSRFVAINHGSACPATL